MNTDIGHTLAEILSAQINTFEAFIDEERNFARALADRDWNTLHCSLSRLETIVATISMIESHREQLRTQMSAPGSEQAHASNSITEHNSDGLAAAGLAIAGGMQNGDQEESIKALRSRLGLVAQRARFMHSCLCHQAKTERDVIKSIVLAVFPEKAHKTYSASGEGKDAHIAAQIVNTRL